MCFGRLHNGKTRDKTMKIPVGSARSLHPQKRTVPPAYPTRVRRTLLAAFHGSYPTSCPFRTRQDHYDFHDILQVSKIILERDSSPLGLLISMPVYFDSLISLFKWMALFSSARPCLSIIFFKLGFTFVHSPLA